MDLINCRKKRRLREQWNNAGTDVVVLHQFWRGKFSPSLSPYVMKVESFLRLHKLKYVSDYEEPMGKTGLCPWITINGKDTCDSNFVIKKLVDHFNLELDQHITEERRVNLDCARIMLEEQIFWTIFLWRYRHDDIDRFLSTQIFPSFYLKFFFKYLIRHHAKKRATAQGMARLTMEDQHNIVINAVKNLNVLFGEGPFFGGDKPCTADCCFFGFISQFVWNEPGSKYEKLIKEEYPLLQKYCFRMKEVLFPDWGLLLNPPTDTTAEKAT